MICQNKRRTPKFLMSTETECLTVVDGDAVMTDVVAEFLGELSQLAPTLPGVQGLFNGYGRVYLDGHHLEFAAAECDSPLSLIHILNRQQSLARVALQRLQKRGIRLFLSSINYGGRLNADAPTWGAHGNFWVQEPPERLADRMIPFLVTRLFAGVGGVLFPSGDYVAGVRLTFLTQDRGGGTMQNRAIHSTARNEHLNPSPERYGYRYHTVLDDATCSPFGTLLRFGTTALVLAAVQDDPEIVEKLPGLRSHLGGRSFWLRACRELNLLAKPGEPLIANAVALRVQRHYLDAVRSQADRWDDPPKWVFRVIIAWEETLVALEKNDHDWLSSRLDAWLKYDLYTALLAQHGANWRDVSQQCKLFDHLLLMDQNYHAINEEVSLFGLLASRGIIGQQVEPCDTELEPFVPELGTRGTDRARFIKKWQSSAVFIADWDTISNRNGTIKQLLSDPFGSEKINV